MVLKIHLACGPQTNETVMEVTCQWREFHFHNTETVWGDLEYPPQYPLRAQNGMSMAGDNLRVKH